MRAAQDQVVNSIAITEQRLALLNTQVGELQNTASNQQLVLQQVSLNQSTQAQQFEQQLSSVNDLCKQGRTFQSELVEKLSHCKQECATQRQKWMYLAGALSSCLHAAKMALCWKMDQILKMFPWLQL